MKRSASGETIRRGAEALGRLGAIATLLALLPAAAGAFDLQGHRGARGLAPENSLYGFGVALRIGVSTLELDVGVSKDNVVVVSHDTRLNPDVTRKPDGTWLAEREMRLKDLTVAEIESYDIGRIDPESRYAERFPDQDPRDGEVIPRLSAVFELVERSGADHVRLNIETKIDAEHPDETVAPEDFVEPLLTAIRAAGMSERVTVQSFDWRTLALVNRRAGNIPTSCLTAEQRWLDNIQRGKPGTSP